jgi:hypothetical protein
VLHGELEYESLGSAPLNENLKDNYFEGEVDLRLGPLLAQPRPHLPSVAIQNGN